MSRRHVAGKNKELRGRNGKIPLNTLLTNDSHRILLTEEVLNNIANDVSAIVKRKISEDEGRELIKFINRLPVHQFYDKTLGDAQKLVAEMFVYRFNANEQSISEEGDLPNSLGLTEIVPDPTMSEYQRKEIMQYTTNENQYKHTAFHNRRGDAFVDNQRVNGVRSTPNSVKPEYRNRKIFTDNPEIDNQILDLMGGLKNFVAPESVDDRFQRSREYWLTDYSITLPHQTIMLDSRNRSLSYDYKKKSLLANMKEIF